MSNGGCVMLRKCDVMQNDGYMQPPQGNGKIYSNSVEHAGLNFGAYGTGTLLGNLLLMQCIACWKATLTIISVLSLT